MFFLKGDDMSLLFVKVNGLVHSFLKSIRDLLHGVDHGSNLDVQSFCK